MRIIWAIHIEGAGATDGSNESGGIMMGTSWAMQVSGGRQGYDWTPRLIDDFGTLAESREPGGRQVQYSGMDFALHGHDDVVTRFLHEADTAVDELAVEMDDSTFDLETQGDVLSVGQVVWIGDEAMRITGSSGGGVYNVIRGYYGSVATPHPADQNVFDEVAQWAGRRVRLYTYDYDADHLEQRWEGRISSRENIALRGARLVIPCVSTYEDLDDMVVLTEPTEFEGDIELLGTPAGPRWVASSADYTTRIRKVSAWEADNKRGWMHFEDFLGYTSGAYLQTLAVLDSRVPDVADGETKVIDRRDIVEPFVVARLHDAASTVSHSSTKDLANTTYPNAELYPYHPVAIAMALRLSTGSTTSDPDNFDVLQPGCSAELKWAHTPTIVADMHALIQRTAWMQVDQFVLGHDPSGAEIMVETRRLLEEWGFRDGTDNEGRQTVYLDQLPDVADYQTALGNKLTILPSDLLDLEDGRGSANDVIEGVVGELPWRKGAKETINTAGDAGYRGRKIKGRADYTHDLRSVSVHLRGKARRILEAIALYRRAPIPRVYGRVADHLEDGLGYGVGDLMTLNDLDLEDAWLVDRDGARILTITDAIQFTGRIFSRRLLKSGAYELGVHLSGDKLIQWRAPSGTLTGYTDNGDGTCTLQFGATSSFGLGHADEYYFTAGDQVRVHTPSLALHESTVLEVASVDTVAHALTCAGTLGTAPDAGHIVEAAHIDSDASGVGYDNDGLDGAYPGVGRVYMFLADAANTLGDADLNADVYGA